MHKRNVEVNSLLEIRVSDVLTLLVVEAANSEIER